MAGNPEPRDRERALALTPVSRETVNRLDRFVDLLGQWQTKTNLVAPSTLPGLWTRHVADSAQLLEHFPEVLRIVDLGSGGGFPGIVLACALADRPGALVHLVESNSKKAAFLREAVRVTGAPARVHAMRIEEFSPQFTDPVELVTARALAPLEELLPLAYPLLQRGARAAFLKGQDVEAELTAASKRWNIEATLIPSKTSPEGRIVLVQSAGRRNANR